MDLDGTASVELQPLFYVLKANDHLPSNEELAMKYHRAKSYSLSLLRA